MVISELLSKLTFECERQERRIATQAEIIEGLRAQLLEALSKDNEPHPKDK